MNISRREFIKGIGAFAAFPLVIREKSSEPTIVECWGYLLTNRVLFELRQYNIPLQDTRKFLQNIKVSPINYGLNLGKHIGFGTSVSSLVPHNFCTVKTPYNRSYSYDKLSMLAQKIQQFIRDTENIFYLALSQKEKEKLTAQLQTYYSQDEAFDSVSISQRSFI